MCVQFRMEPERVRRRAAGVKMLVRRSRWAGVKGGAAAAAERAA